MLTRRRGTRDTEKTSRVRGHQFQWGGLGNRESDGIAWARAEGG